MKLSWILVLVGIVGFSSYSFSTGEVGQINTGDISIAQPVDSIADTSNNNMHENIKEYKEELKQVFDNYLLLLHETKKDFWLYMRIVIGILTVGAIIVWFYITKITNSIVKTYLKDTLQPIIDAKITDYDKKIDQDFQRIGAEVKEKNIIIMSLDVEGLALVTIRNQGFTNIIELTEIVAGIDADAIVIDMLNLDMSISENVGRFSAILESIGNDYQNVPLLIFYKTQLSRTDFQFPSLTTFANNQLSLVSNLYDCLRYQKDIGNARVQQ